MKRWFASIVLAGCAAKVLAGPGLALVAGDEWIFSDPAFDGYAPEGYAGNANQNQILLSNFFSYMTSNSLGTGKSLSLGGANVIELGTHFASTAASFGETVDFSSAQDSAANYNLMNYDIVSVEETYLHSENDCRALYNYVMAGGHLFIRAGVGDQDQTTWNQFLPTFGMSMDGLTDPVYAADVTITGGLNSIVNGASSYTWSLGNPIEVTGPEAQLAVIGTHPIGLMGSFVDNPNIATPFRFVPASTPEPSTILALGVMVGPMLVRRRKRQK